MNITNIFGRIRRMTSKQVITAGVFAIALAGAVGLGLAVKQTTSAASIKDCTDNAILRCGAEDREEFIADIKVMNTRDQKYQGDLTTIYNHFGLTKDKYDRFAKTARQGLVYRNGDVVVDKQIVMRKSESIGRQKFNDSRHVYKIGNNTYYTGTNEGGYGPGVQTIPAMVMFDDKGEVEAIAMNPCGNPVHGEKVKNTYECKSLTQTKISDNKFKFTADAVATNNAKIVEYEFNFGDGVKKTSTSPTIEHIYAKPGKYTATVNVTVKLPGDKTATVTGIKCKTEVEVVAPYYACVKLMAQTSDVKKQKFTFTAVADYNNQAKLIDADFSADGKVFAEGVKPNSDNKTFTTERTFTDKAKHEIVAKLNFDIAGKVTSVTCKTQIESEKTPVCIVNNKPFPNEQNPYAPNDERCKAPECKPGIPENDERCKETPVTPAPELPKTGAGSLIGLFAGTSIVGAAAHRVFMSRRANRSEV